MQTYTQSHPADTLIFGSGEMADRIRDFAWENTVLGAMDTWPAEMVSIVNLMLCLPGLASVALGPDLLLLYNDAYIPILQGRHPKALGRPVSETWSETWGVTGPGFEAALREGRSQSWEELAVPLVCDGRVRETFWSYTLSPIHFDHRIVGVLSIGQDVTERVLAARRHKQTTRQLQQVLDTTTDGVLSVDRSWRVTYVNRRGEQILSPIGDLVGHNLMEKFPGTLYEGSPFLESYRETMNRREATHFDVFYPAPLNLWFSVLCEPSEDGIVIFFRDVTEERREAAALREHQARLKAMYSTSNEYIGLLSPEGVVLEVNDAALSFDGSAREQVLGQMFWDGPWFRNTPGVQAPVRAAIARAAAGEQVHDELPLCRPDGEMVTFDFSLSPVRDETGRIVYLVPEGYDISPLKRAQAMLVQNEKLAAVGRLASTIAHEINNPLESVTNLLYLAKNSPHPAQVKEYLDIAEGELLRVSAISSQTLRFHKQASMPRSVSAGELFSTVLAMHHARLAGFRIQLEKDALSPTPVVCFEGEIRQVLNNLIGNAIDAMGARGGRLILRARAACQWPGGRPGLRITVADTGSGIAPDTLKHIFEPFFTTKGIAGTGLGLWVSQQIVERHQGTLRIRSRQGEGKSGTVFVLFLPFDAAVR
jgi:PAS domain S-box-containing protein